MKGYIKTETLLFKLQQMRNLLADALKYDNSIIGELLQNKRLGSVKTLDDIIKMVKTLEREGD